jgi:hypothetical protein
MAGAHGANNPLDSAFTFAPYSQLALVADLRSNKHSFVGLPCASYRTPMTLKPSPVQAPPKKAVLSVASIRIGSSHAAIALDVFNMATISSILQTWTITVTMTLVHYRCAGGFNLCA